MLEKLKKYYMRLENVRCFDLGNFIWWYVLVLCFDIIWF